MYPRFTIKHPFSAVLPGRRAGVFVPLLCLTTAAWAGKEFINRNLETALTPDGFISIALAQDSQTAQIILHSWTQAGLLPYAFFSLGLQFLWLVSFSTTLSFACVWASQKMMIEDWVEIGKLLAWTQWMGALVGAAAGITVGFLLGGRLESPWPAFAYWFTLYELLAFAFGAAYAAGGLVVRELPRGFRSFYMRH